MSARLRLSSCGLGAGKRARLHRILYKHGLGNGTALFLPYDQGLEHGRLHSLRRHSGAERRLRAVPNRPPAGTTARNAADRMGVSPR